MVIPGIDLNIVKEFGRQRSIQEETILLKEGEKAASAYFVISGGVRLFFYTEKSEVTLEFFFENSFVSSFSSFTKGAPSNYWLETIEPSELLDFSKDNIKRMSHRLPNLQSQYGEALENRLSEYIQRLHTFLSLNAQERYEELVTSRPDLLLRVKQKYLASYIGIAPESLSRIRSNRIR